MNDKVTLRLPAPAKAALRLAGSDPDDSDRMWPAEHCGHAPWEGDYVDVRGCAEKIDEGDPVRKLDGAWMHAHCAREAVVKADVDEAWLLLADQVAARPHVFRATEIRTVLNAVSAIASRARAANETRRSSVTPIRGGAA